MTDPGLTDLRRGSLSRRTLLAGGLATLVAGGASGCRSGDEPVAKALSARQLITEDPFFVGSRGGAREWPELTAYGFEQAALVPEIKAMEIMVCRTSDGVLVCSSEPTTKRVTGKDLTILDETWATLSSLQVSARQTRDPDQPSRPIARLDEILERHIDRFVMFVEPRVPEATTNLMAMLISLGRPERVVWKQPINGVRFDDAKQHGFCTWGYSLDEPSHTGKNLTTLAASDTLDLLGASWTQPAKLQKAVVEAAGRNQKPAVAWNVDSRTALDRARKTGFTGIATKAVAELAVAKP